MRERGPGGGGLHQCVLWGHCRAVERGQLDGELRLGRPLRPRGGRRHCSEQPAGGPASLGKDNWLLLIIRFMLVSLLPRTPSLEPRAPGGEWRVKGDIQRILRSCLDPGRRCLDYDLPPCEFPASFHPSSHHWGPGLRLIWPLHRLPRCMRRGTPAPLGVLVLWRC